MHARVLSGHSRPGAMTELARLFTGEAHIHTLPRAGYQGALLVGDQGTGKLLLITLWDSEQAMQAGEQDGYLQERLGNFAHLLLNAPARDHYEVQAEAGTLGAAATGAVARVTSGQAQADKLDDIGRIFQGDVMPVFQTQAGFIGTLLLGNNANNKSMAVSLWHTEADLRASEHSGYYHEQIAKLAHLYAGAANREHYQVLAHL